MAKVKLIATILMAVALLMTWKESQAEKLTRNEVHSGAASQLIATSTRWIDRDREEIRVYRSGVLVELPAGFHELLVATPVPGYARLDKLVGRSVAIVRSVEHADRWDIFVGVGGGVGAGAGATEPLTLADNVFRVSQVLVSSSKNSVELLVGGKVYLLKSGQALLVL